MGIFGRKQTGIHGFTLIELIVVIATIAILASITLVFYPNYIRTTHDNGRKSDLQQVAAALGAYALQKDSNKYMETGSGCGQGGNGSGWMNLSGGTYGNSIVSCLQTAKVLGSGTFIDPLGCTSASGGKCGTWRGNPAQAYMKLTCKKGGSNVTYVMAHLELQPRKDAEVDALCDVGGAVDAGFDASSQNWGTDYGMNYYVSVK